MRSVVRCLLLATFFCITFEKVFWEVAGAVELADLLAVMFLFAYAFERFWWRERRVTKTSAVVLAFAAAFLLVYLIGFFNLDTGQALAQFGKGMFKFAVHFLFLIAAVDYISRRPPDFYWKVLGAFVAGIVVNGIYGILQLLAAGGGVNLDSIVLSPLTGGASQINIYGRAEGQSVFRVNALTGDPNHLGIMVLVPLLVLIPIYLRMERRHRLRLPIALTLAFLVLVLASTLSRSGALGLIAGLLVLMIPYRGLVLTRRLLLPVGAAALVLGVVILSRLHFFETVLASRFQVAGANGTSAHFGVYAFIPRVLHAHPLFGFGLNNFSVYYQLITGKTNWGPHSFYVALIVESGIVGTVLFSVFLWYVFRRLHATRAIGRALAALGDPEAARIRPLAWGLTAALVGTMAANSFYLTMTFYYFFAFIALALAAPIVFSSAASRADSSPASRA